LIFGAGWNNQPPQLSILPPMMDRPKAKPPVFYYTAWFWLIVLVGLAALVSLLSILWIVRDRMRRSEYTPVA